MKWKMVLIFSLLALAFGSIHAQAAKKKNIAVIDLDSRGGLSKAEVGTLTDRLRSMLVRTHAFTVVDRGLMEDVLSEQGFQMSGCTSTDCAVEAGKILGVEQMLSGTIGRLGKLYTIDIILIDVSTSQIIKSLTRDYRGEVEGLVGLMKSVADELAGAAPAKTKPVAQKKAPKKYTLSFTSTPSGAQVVINNKKAGTTPYSIKVNEGMKLDIQVKKTNYQTVQKALLVKKDESFNMKLEYSDAYKKFLLAQQQKKKSAGTKTVSKGSSGLWWWIGGGVAVAATVAYFLIPDNTQSASASFPQPPARP